MAIATIEITCKVCGTSFTHRHESRNRTDAESYKAWAADHIDTCPKCYAAAQKAAEEEIADAQAAALGLPELVGTEKQIAWAKRIRYELVAESEKYGFTVDIIRQVIAAGKEDNIIAMINQTGYRAKATLYAYKAVTENSAKWWIDNN